MMLPIRCFTCNNLLAHHWEKFHENGVNKKDYMERHNIRRMCCRRMLLCHVSVIDDVLLYTNSQEMLDESNTEFDCFTAVEQTISCD